MEQPVWRWIASPTARPQGRPEWARILPALLIGEYPTPDDAQWLRAAHGVTAVLSLQDEADLASKGLDLPALERAYDECGLLFRRLPIADCDVAGLGARLDAAVETLAELIGAGQRVYLHCNGGLNRAPTVAIAYLHARHGLSLEAARDFVRGQRHCAPYMSVLRARYGPR